MKKGPGPVAPVHSSYSRRRRRGGAQVGVDSRGALSTVTDRSVLFITSSESSGEAMRAWLPAAAYREWPSRRRRFDVSGVANSSPGALAEPAAQGRPARSRLLLKGNSTATSMVALARWGRHAETCSRQEAHG